MKIYLGLRMTDGLDVFVVLAMLVVLLFFIVSQL